MQAVSVTPGYKLSPEMADRTLSIPMRCKVLEILVLLLLSVPYVAVAQCDADSKARERAVEYCYLQAISMLEQDSLDASYDMLEHCRLLAPASGKRVLNS